MSDGPEASTLDRAEGGKEEGESEGLQRGSWSLVSRSEGGQGKKVAGRWRNGGIAGEEVDCGPGWRPEKYVSS